MRVGTRWRELKRGSADDGEKLDKKKGLRCHAEDRKRAQPRGINAATHEEMTSTNRRGRAEGPGTWKEKQQIQLRGGGSGKQDEISEKAEGWRTIRLQTRENGVFANERPSGWNDQGWGWYAKSPFGKKRKRWGVPINSKKGNHALTGNRDAGRRFRFRGVADGV